MWGRIRGQVLRSGDKDNDDNDTIISRALLRYYAPEVPSWLGNTGDAVLTMEQNEQLNYQHQYQQQYIKRDYTDRTNMFDRKGSVASLSETPSPTPSTQPSTKTTSSSSKLANRLKNTKW